MKARALSGEMNCDGEAANLEASAKSVRYD
jgi:hypothetical protein